jgi:hypothetical protein
MTSGRCLQESELQTIDDFQPLIEELLRSYVYVWIYAAKAAGYNPYDKTIAPAYNDVISKALREHQSENRIP